MNFFAVLAALVIEQLKPLPQRNPVHDAFTGWMRWCGRNFDAGKPRHAWVVWLIAVALPAALAFVVHALLAQTSQAVALLWSVAVLYVTLGFRQFSHYFTDIRNALERGDETTARSLLGQWRQLDASELPRGELLRHVLEHSLLAAHRHVFGVFFWFVLLSTLGLGPAGAVLYRMAEFARRYWAHKGRQAGAAVNPALLDLATTLFGWIDHVPARLTAFGFAVVGNFEDAVACWRRDAGLWRHGNEGVLLASAAGALGVQLGGRAAPGVGPDRAESDEASEAAGAEASTPGAPPQLGHLQSVVGLVWRSVVLWMLLLALLSLANLVG